MKKLMWLLPLVTMIISCGGEEETEGYLPLAVGNQWTYDMTYMMVMMVDTFQTTGTSTTEITRETVLNNNTAVLEQVTTNTWDDTLIVPNSVDTTYLLETEDHLLVYDDLDDTEPDTSLVLPFETGNTWTVYADTMDTLTAEVIGQETATVPAGTYNDCWNVEYISMGQTQNNWFALDVGIVLHHMYIDEMNVLVESTKELTSFNVQ